MKIAVIGAGYWGPNHVRVFNSLPNVTVSHVADLDAERLARVKAAHPGVATVADYRQVLADPSVTAVVVATPTSTHYAVARDAILAGKHVLCEKPLCQTVEEGRHLRELAESMHVIAMVGHVFLFNAGIIKLKQLIDDLELGRLLYLSAQRTNLGPIRSDVNAAFDLATHDISIFNWLVGSAPISASATGGAFVRQGVEDVVFISLKYPNDVIASIIVSWLDPKKVRQITAVGTQRMATWDDLQAATPVAIFDKGAQTTQEYGDFGEFQRLTMWDGDVRLPKVRSEEPLKTQAQFFVDAVASGRLERSGVQSGLDVVGTLRAISESISLGGAPVQVRP